MDENAGKEEGKDGDQVLDIKKNREEQQEQIQDDSGAFDDARFIEKMGTEKYITFAEFAKIMSIFNPRTGIDEKIQCKCLLVG